MPGASGLSWIQATGNTAVLEGSYERQRQELTMLTVGSPCYFKTSLCLRLPSVLRPPSVLRLPSILRHSCFKTSL